MDSGQKMSNQTSQRVRRMASPSTIVTKAGPLKATQTFGLKHGSPTTIQRPTNGRKTSPSSSPTPQHTQWDTPIHRKTRRSPDSRHSPDRTSPSSPGFKEKTKPVRHSPAPPMKRTGSYDTIAPYLKGEWPKDISITVTQAPPLRELDQNRDESTQTPDEWEVIDSNDRKKKGSHKRSSSLGNGDSLKEFQKIKAHLAKSRSKEGGRVCGVGNPRASPVHGNHLISSLSSSSALQSKALAIPHIPKPSSGGKIRGSVEGLNQEIANLVLKNNTVNSGNEVEQLLFRTQEPTPDGHRAPVRELLGANMIIQRTMDRPTQTPSDISGFMEETRSVDTASSTSSSSSTGNSPQVEIESYSPACYPIIPGHMDGSRPSSRSDSSEGREDKDCADSPDPESCLFVREPPDGCVTCEKIKFVEEPRAPPVKELLFTPIKKSVHIPSELSAFCSPLYKSYVSQPSEMALKTTPTSTPSVIESK